MEAGVCKVEQRFDLFLVTFLVFDLVLEIRGERKPSCRQKLINYYRAFQAFATELSLFLPSVLRKTQAISAS